MCAAKIYQMRYLTGLVAGDALRAAKSLPYATPRNGTCVGYVVGEHVASPVWVMCLSAPPHVPPWGNALVVALESRTRTGDGDALILCSVSPTGRLPSARGATRNQRVCARLPRAVLCMHGQGDVDGHVALRQGRRCGSPLLLEQRGLRHHHPAFGHDRAAVGVQGLWRVGHRIQLRCQPLAYSCLLSSSTYSWMLTLAQYLLTYLFGTYQMREVVGDSVLSAPMLQWGPVYTEFVNKVLTDTWVEDYQAWPGAAEGAVKLMPTFSPRVDPATVQYVEQARALIPALTFAASLN